MSLGMGMGLWLGHNPAVAGGGGVAAMTLNGSDKTAGVTLSNGNLTATGPGGSSYECVRSTRAIGVSKAYWEVAPSAAFVEIGVCDGGVTLVSGNGVYWGLSAFSPQVATSHAVGWQGNDSQIMYNDTNTTITGFVGGDTIGIYWDDTAEKIWFTKDNSTFYPSGNPSAGTGGFSAPGLNSDHFPFVTVGGSASAVMNFGTTQGGTSGFLRTPVGTFVAP